MKRTHNPSSWDCCFPHYCPHFMASNHLILTLVSTAVLSLSHITNNLCIIYDYISCQLTSSGTKQINHRFVPAVNWTVKSSVVHRRQLTCSWGCFHEPTVNSSDVHRSIIIFLIYSGDIMMIINHLSKIWHFSSVFWSSLQVYNFPLPQNACAIIDLCVVLGFVNKVHFLHFDS